MSMRNFFIVIGLGASFLALNAYADFASEIFTYEDVESAKNLHVSLKGSGWYVQDVKKEDIPFHQKLFGDSVVMAGFADGQVRDPKATKARLEDLWIPRFEQGHPHGGLTIFDPETAEPMGHVVAGGGDGLGVSEIAYSFLKQHWGKGIGKGVVGAIVQEWAPEVRRIGLGTDLDVKEEKPVIDAFRCFGGEVLKRLDATASPSNPGSWKILDKYDFKPAKFNLSEKETVLDLDGGGIEKLEEVEEEVLKLFDISSSEKPLKVGLRYRMVDSEGTLRTFSKHTQYDRIKYHFEREVK